MKGIPVRANGDPVTLTLVYAGSYQQFDNWCMYSRVNRNSRMVKYISGPWCLRGYRNFDLVYTGTNKAWHDERLIADEIAYHQATRSILNVWSQYESCEIEPDVVD